MYGGKTRITTVRAGHRARPTQETAHHNSPYRKIIRTGECPGFFEPEELEAIVSFLPSYLKDVLRFAYHTGWRKGEILTLEWRDIHRDLIRLRPEIAKNKDSRMIILAGALSNMIDLRLAERVESCPHVFHRNITRIKHYNRAWHTIREKVGLPNKRFHHSRRTAVRNMDRAGVPRQTSKQITGHQTDAVYNRIVNEQDIREDMSWAEAYLDAQKADNTWTPKCNRNLIYP